MASKSLSNSIFDYVINLQGGGSASVTSIAVGVLPVLSLVLPLLIDHTQNEMVILRIREKRKLYYNQFLINIFISVFITLCMVVVGVIATLIFQGSISNLWGSKAGTLYFLLDNKSLFSIYKPHVGTFEVWIYIISSRFLGILFMATSICFLKALLKKNVYVFFLALLLLGTDSLFSEKFSFCLGRLKTSMSIWVSPSDQLFNLIYFVFGIAVLSLITLKLYDRKEFYK